MTRHRVAITGIGLVTPLGCDREEVWKSLLAGRSGVRPIKSFDTAGFDTTIGAECVDFNPNRWIDEREAKRLDRFSQFGIAAGSMAIQDSELNIEKIDLIIWHLTQIKRALLTADSTKEVMEQIALSL